MLSTKKMKKEDDIDGKDDAAERTQEIGEAIYKLEKKCVRDMIFYEHKRVDGTMYSCTSLGIKLGGGIGIAITGWLLDFSGFDGTLAVQSDSCIQMLQIMYLWILDRIIFLWLKTHVTID
jgi:hypothetical protein